MIIISPSKNLNLSNENFSNLKSKPEFQGKIKFITKAVKSLKKKELKSLMNISDKLVELNHQRFNEFDKPQNTLKPAALMFSGDTFNGLSIRDMSSESLDYAQNNLRILSGLYGVLKPFDQIQPYRLEMGTDTSKFMSLNLYEFWRKTLTDYFNNQLKKSDDNLLYNLSSKEYISVLSSDNINAEIINFDFKKKVNTELKNIGMSIKKMRGLMAKFIIEKKIKKLEYLENFQFNGFFFKEYIPETQTFLYVSQ